MLSLKLFRNDGSYLIIAPHCDDELLACGGIIQQARKNNNEVKVVFLTNGDGFRWAAVHNFKRPYISAEKFKMLGKMRQIEALSVANYLGLKREDIYFLGYPDGGLNSLWAVNWLKEIPFTSRYTRTNINPYSISYRQGQPYTGEELTYELEKLIYTLKPKKIFLPSQYDNHSDHWSAYNFIGYVLIKLKLEGKIVEFPQLYQYLIHWSRWPLSSGVGNDFIEPPLQFEKLNNSWLSFTLTSEQIDKKNSALKAYKTQVNVMKSYLESFVKKNEIFIADKLAKSFSIKTDVLDNQQLEFSSMARNMVFYQPGIDNNKINRRIGTKIAKLILENGENCLTVKVKFLNRYLSGQTFRLRAILLSRNNNILCSRDFELIIPSARKNSFIINHYLESTPGLYKDMFEIKWRGKSLLVNINNLAIKESDYLFITTEIHRKGRIVDRTSWKIIALC